MTRAPSGKSDQVLQVGKGRPGFRGTPGQGSDMASGQVSKRSSDQGSGMRGFVGG